MHLKGNCMCWVRLLVIHDDYQSPPSCQGLLLALQHQPQGLLNLLCLLVVTQQSLQGQTHELQLVGNAAACLTVCSV